MHHTILKNVFELRDHSTRRVLIDRMNRIWRRRWNIANVRRKHLNWFNWRYVRRIWSVVFLFATSFSFCRNHSIVLTTALIRCDVKTKKKLFFSKEKFFFVYSWSLIELLCVLNLIISCFQFIYSSFFFSDFLWFWDWKIVVALMRRERSIKISI
jgi:hypothetical protein